MGIDPKPNKAIHKYMTNEVFVADDPEKGLISALWHCPDLLTQVKSQVPTGTIFDPACAVIFEAMVEVHEPGSELNATKLFFAARKLADHSPELKKLIEEDGESEFRNLFVETTGYLGHYEDVRVFIDQLRERSRKNRLLTLSENFSLAAGNGQASDEILHDFLAEANSIDRSFGKSNHGIHLVNCSDIKSTMVQWVWDEWLALGCLSILDGDPGVGKTTILCDLIARLTTGQPRPPIPGMDEPPYKPLDVVWLNGEDPRDSILKPRLEACGADLTKVHFIEEGDQMIQLPRDTDLLFEQARSVGGRVLLLDPLDAYIGPDIDTKTSASMKPVLHRIASRSYQNNIATLGVRHLTKQPGGRAIYRGQGSIATIASARTAWIVGPDPDDEHTSVLACSKTNLGFKPMAQRFHIEAVDSVSRIAWDSPIDIDADELMASGKSGKMGKLTAVDTARGLKAKGDLSDQQIFDQIESSFSRSTAYDIRRELGLSNGSPWIK